MYHVPAALSWLGHKRSSSCPRYLCAEAPDLWTGRERRQHILGPFTGACVRSFVPGLPTAAPTADCVSRLSSPMGIPRPHMSAARRMCVDAGIHKFPEALPVSCLPRLPNSEVGSGGLIGRRLVKLALLYPRTFMSRRHSMVPTTREIVGLRPNRYHRHHHHRRSQHRT
ncbi:hypothetical protein EDB89DRAFT_1982490 [Lactarius sanguifluus]|nr:hypothetical protein EDB89DRAFT_1982490 [Lactarius sanguifluus]